MVVSGVDGRNLTVLRCVGRVEIVGADSEALKTDAEDLSLNAVFHIVLLHGKNLVERVFEKAAIEVVVDGNILAAVVHPKVHYARVSLRLANHIGNFTAAPRMLNPEITYSLVRVGE